MSYMLKNGGYATLMNPGGNSRRIVNNVHRFSRSYGLCFLCFLLLTSLAMSYRNSHLTGYSCIQGALTEALRERLPRREAGGYAKLRTSRAGRWPGYRTVRCDGG